MSTRLMQLYDRLVLRVPGRTVLVLLVLFACLGYQVRNFRLDASADSLVLEHDPDLRYWRTVSKRYDTAEFVLIAYIPKHRELLADATLTDLRRLRDDLRALPRVGSVVTILDVPLLQNPPVSIKDLEGNIKHLGEPGVDRELARRELSNSPVFRDLLVSPNLRSTAVIVYLERDPELDRLLKRRVELSDREYDHTLTAAERAEFARVKAEFKVCQDRINRQRHQDIRAVREVMGGHRAEAELFLGGVPMISDDMISFVKKDLKMFGAGMVLFLILTLGMIFRRKRWIMLPMLCCGFSVLCMVGILGIAGWEVTVISSNFISLQLIMTMSLAIHVIVRYTELLAAQPNRDNRELVLETVRTIFKPCLYTTLTTIAGFSSLVTCDILPVINFGWMMTLGLCVSLAVTFLLFPAGLLLLPRARPPSGRRFGMRLTGFFARLTDKHGRAIVVVSAGIAVFTLAGMARLEVENSFIDYFRETTEIYRGMKFIDNELGGTTPLDVIVDVGSDAAEASASRPAPVPPSTEADVFAGFEDELEAAPKDEETYWYTARKVALIRRVHEYLEAQPETGKVLSLDTLMTLAGQLSGRDDFDSLELALFFKALPPDMKALIVEPYVSIPDNELRVSLRIKDSLETLRRDALLKRIRRGLAEDAGLEPEQFRLAGVMVLYNNMLQSLFRSQIRTIGVTVLALMIMFMLLFHSLRIAIIAILPNLMASLVVLGVMGTLGVPLDMMTITIVAISVGIAVDDTIHYLHRFRREFAVDGDYRQAMFRCHGSIGNAMYYTSITITIGFSILTLSNFIPTILFGLLTGVAMVMALLAALTLLPRLILLAKPFGPGRPGADA